MADDHVAKRTDRGLAVQEPVLASWAATLRSVNGSRLVLKDRTLIDSSQQAGILTASALLEVIDMATECHIFTAHHKINNLDRSKQ